SMPGLLLQARVKVFPHCARRALRALALVSLWAAAWSALAQSTAAAVPGLRLPRNVAPLAYEAQLHVDPASEVFSGELAITVRVFEPTDLIWLNARNLRISEARGTV